MARHLKMTKSQAFSTWEATKDDGDELVAIVKAGGAWYVTYRTEDGALRGRPLS